MGRGEDTKERILRAAEEVVLRDGVASLTLERAATEAGVSKGGVLYHFPSRDAMVAAMVERLTESFERQLAAHGAGRPGPGVFTVAYIRCEATPTTDPEEERADRLGAALIAAVAADPALISPLAKAFDRWQKRCETDGIPPVLATVARLAADGLWLTELLGLGTLSPGRRAEVVAWLEGIVTDAAQDPARSLCGPTQRGHLRR